MPLVLTVETDASRQKALVLLSAELAPGVLLRLTKINMFTVSSPFTAAASIILHKNSWNSPLECPVKRRAKTRQLGNDWTFGRAAQRWTNTERGEHVAGTDQSVLRLPTGWTVRGSNPDRSVQAGPRPHPASYDIFVNCNWVNTRWQWYSTHDQYIGQHK